MDYARFRATSLITLIACLTTTGLASQDYEQLLNDEASEAVIDPTSADPKLQNRKDLAPTPRRSSLNQEKFELNLHKNFPGTFSVYSALTAEAQQKIYTAFKANSDPDYINDLILSTAKK